jgi:hypothetical protein
VPDLSKRGNLESSDDEVLCHNLIFRLVCSDTDLSACAYSPGRQCFMPETLYASLLPALLFSPAAGGPLWIGGVKQEPVLHSPQRRRSRGKSGLWKRGKVIRDDRYISIRHNQVRCHDSHQDRPRSRNTEAADYLLSSLIVLADHLALEREETHHHHEVKRN